MKSILITGATGNVGSAVISSLLKLTESSTILAGVRSPKKEYPFLTKHNIKKVHFDFEDQSSISKALKETDVLFLLRPPQISDAKKYFQPLVDSAKTNNIEHIVFLSVQGAETSSLIPHHKIEKIIQDSGIDYTFLRPAYFMQNFTTTLRQDIIENDLIYLPAGKAKFTIINLNDVGSVGAKILVNLKPHVNQAYDLTNYEQITFEQMAKQLTNELDRKIAYKCPSLIAFFLRKKREGVPTMFILVMIMLHYLPRFKKTPPISDNVLTISGKKPTPFRDFVASHKQQLTKSGN